MPSATLVQAYVEAVKGRAIYVQAMAAFEGHRISRVTFDDLKLFETFAKFEFEKPSHAELVMSRCLDYFASVGAMRHDGWINKKPAEVEAQIIEIARFLGAGFHDGKETVQKAERMVAGIIAKMDEMRRNGDLQEINKKYKVYRLGQVAKGEKAVSYNAYLAKYHELLVVHAAATSGEAIPKRESAERYDDGMKRGRPDVPGWTHPHNFGQRR